MPRLSPEPYRYNPHAPSHLNQAAREEARKRGEDTTAEDARQTADEHGGSTDEKR